MARRNRTLAAILLAASLALAGCGADGDSGASGADAKAQVRGADGPEAADGAGAEAAAGYGDSGKDDRGGRGGEGAGSGAELETTHIIRTARLSVSVRSVPEALAEVRSVAETAGGFVAREETDSYEGGRIDSTEVVLRVPSAKYDEVMNDLKGTGTVTYRSSQAEDVTDQVVDVESRVKSQRAAVDRLRKLMDEATELEDVVLLEGELASREAELDSLLSRRASLKDRTSLATVTLDLVDRDRVDEVREEDADPGILDALRGGWDAFVTTLYWIVLVVGAALPFAVVLGALLWLWLRLRRRSRAAGPASDAADDAAGDAPHGAPGEIPGEVPGDRGLADGPRSEAGDGPAGAGETASGEGDARGTHRS
jgi:hypothetical protein